MLIIQDTMAPAVRTRVHPHSNVHAGIRSRGGGQTLVRDFGSDTIHVGSDVSRGFSQDAGLHR